MIIIFSGKLTLRLLENLHFSIGNTSSKGPFFPAMLVYQRVIHQPVCKLQSRIPCLPCFQGWNPSGLLTKKSMEYLNTWMVDFYGKCRYIYTSPMDLMEINMAGYFFTWVATTHFASGSQTWGREQWIIGMASNFAMHRFKERSRADCDIVAWEHHQDTGWCNKNSHNSTYRVVTTPVIHSFSAMYREHHSICN